MRTIQDLLGHEDITTTEIYLHVSMSHGLGVSSPLDEELKHQELEDGLMAIVARRHLHGLPRLVGAATA